MGVVLKKGGLGGEGGYSSKAEVAICGLKWAFSINTHYANGGPGKHRSIELFRAAVSKS